VRKPNGPLKILQGLLDASLGRGGGQTIIWVEHGLQIDVELGRL
jgi:hypothetical protein